MVLQALASLGAAVDRDTGWLVDHQHQPIAVQQASHHLFRCDLCLHRRNRYQARSMNDNAKDAPEAGGKKSWWQRLTGGLKRTSGSIATAISDLVTRGPLSPERIVEIEETLIRADLGVDVAARMATTMGEGRYRNLDEVKTVLAAEVEKVLAPVAKPLSPSGTKPFVILVVGVNGSGKTTTIGKLAARYRAEGKRVLLAAGDTFRAAAIDQLKI